MAIKRGSGDSDLVWSSDQGDLRKEGGRKQARKSRKAAHVQRSSGASNAGGAGRIKVRRETSGRRGKTVTTISGISLPKEDIALLAAELKKLCGVGGTARGNAIELQGDHRDKVLERLKEKGLDAVAAGG